MTASISFTDGIGPAVLANGFPTPGDRFLKWTQDPKPVGPSTNRQSDGALFMYRLRDDYGASFQLSGLSSKTVAGVSAYDIAARLVYHLRNGGTCSIATGDSSSHVYATCGLMPGTTPTLELTDRANFEWTLSLAVINLAGSPAPMVCYYAGGT